MVIMWSPMNCKVRQHIKCDKQNKSVMLWSVCFVNNYIALVIDVVIVCRAQKIIINHVRL